MPHTLITGPEGKKYQTYELTGSGITKDGESGRPWRNFDPTILGRHWGKRQSELDRLDAEGLIHWPKNGGWPRERSAHPFIPSERMVTVGSVWTDINRLNQSDKRVRLGYPTQKPPELLKRIIHASSSPGDVVFDPFCGCGTTIYASHETGRHWVGCDIAILAVKLVRDTLAEKYRLGPVGIQREFTTAAAR